MAERPVALVTGSNRGLGHGIASAFHAAGYRVVSLNRTLADEAWLGELRCDLLDPGQIATATSRLHASLPGIRVCILNAAVRRLAAIKDLCPAEWSASVAVNLSSAFHLIKGTLPLVRRARGWYVVIGSHAADHYFEGGAAYSASKAGLRALVGTLLLEERRNGVRATLVSAGAIANRADDRSATKMSPRSVGALLVRLVDLPEPDIAVGEVEIRPGVLGESQVVGIGRLQQI